MSTRAGIIVKDNFSEVHFYHHSDGYPEVTLNSLNIFLGWLKEGKIRDNTGQAAGWLIVLGAMEYNTIPEFGVLEPFRPGSRPRGDRNAISAPTDWKVGAYEPTDNVSNHGDLKYIYTVDLVKKEITYKEL